MAKFSDFACLTMLVLATATAVVAQGANQAPGEKCAGLVYQAKEVSKKAKITSKPPPSYTEDARTHNISGRVDLTAVLCRSGRVTDIQIVKGLPYGLTQSAIDAVKSITFEPAQKDGEAVSQTMHFEYGFNVDPPGHRALAKEPVDGRNVEVIAVIGLVCHSRQEIWPLIKTRIGSPYHKDQGEQDLRSLLALGYFDNKATHLRIEEGERGGIGLTFFLKELMPSTPCRKQEGP